MRSKHDLICDAVPSIFAWSKSPSTSSQNRDKRMLQKERRKLEGESFDEIIPAPTEFCVNLAEVLGTTEYPHGDEAETESVSVAELSSKTVHTQASMSTAKLSIEELCTKPDMLHYYTGLVNCDFFLYVLGTLGRSAYHLKYRESMPAILSVENQFLLTLICAFVATHHSLNLDIYSE